MKKEFEKPIKKEFLREFHLPDSKRLRNFIADGNEFHCCFLFVRQKRIFIQPVGIFNSL